MNKTEFLSNLAAQEIDAYQAQHRHPDRPRFDIGPVVDLFPERDVTLQEDEISPWSEPWPYRRSAGVYLIYSVDRELLYIGKASMGQSIDRRLYCHFGGNEEQCFFCEDTWKTKPRFVVIVAMPEQSPFEAPALEEFLISKLSPKMNIYGMQCLG